MSRDIRNSGINCNGSVVLGDCLKKMTELPDNSVDLIYLDPPFFTQKKHTLTSREDEEFAFDDKWQSHTQYLAFMGERLKVFKDKLKKTGSIFLHCDGSSSHYLKILLDEIFGAENFQSEIIWTYRRWSNAKKGLLQNHQNILFYSKTEAFKFNRIYDNYSATTNLDQIVQLRVRDHRGKTVYKKTESGAVALAIEKPGVPLGDVWEIPYLNPKAKERVGYPTQKPILLLERIINLVTDKGDFVVDPFCGSGTTLVAAKLCDRRFWGIDINRSAVKLSERRLETPTKTESKLLQRGRRAYEKNDPAVKDIVDRLQARPVQRNKGIDALVTASAQLVPVKIAKCIDDLAECARLLKKSTSKNEYKHRAIFLDLPLAPTEVEKFEKKYDVLLIPDLKSLNEKIKS